MEDTIRTRLMTADLDLLKAFEDNGDSLEEFAESWTSLVRDVDSARLNGTLSPSLNDLASVVASRIALLSQSFHDLHADTEALESHFSSEIASILAEGTGTPPPYSPSHQSHHSLYVESAYRWLVDNLHNPYPSKQLRVHLAKKSGSAVKDIDSWFTDVRRRIGWNYLRRDAFSNKRSSIVNAATRFYLDKDCDSLSADIQAKFIAIRQATLNLYNKFGCTSLVSQLTKDSECSANEHTPSDPEYTYLSISRSSSVDSSQSRTLSPAVSLSPEVPQLRAKRKRSAEPEVGCQHKRPRASMADFSPIRPGTSPMSLPVSTPQSTHDSPKSRLSDFVTVDLPHQATRTTMTTIDAASDLCPIQSTLDPIDLDDWFRTMNGQDLFNLEALNTTNPLDIELFDCASLLPSLSSDGAVISALEGSDSSTIPDPSTEALSTQCHTQQTARTSPKEVQGLSEFIGTRCLASISKSWRCPRILV
uniref:HD1 protein n=1 Tax=Volvariella volvacea TaxID=36659 RepID=A0A1B2U729_9AGAR|nr:HD1 protein [Volvariella volvacea]